MATPPGTPPSRITPPGTPPSVLVPSPFSTQLPSQSVQQNVQDQHALAQQVAMLQQQLAQQQQALLQAQQAQAQAQQQLPPPIQIPSNSVFASVTSLPPTQLQPQQQPQLQPQQQPQQIPPPPPMPAPVRSAPAPAPVSTPAALPQPSSLSYSPVYTPPAPRPLPTSGQPGAASGATLSPATAPAPTAPKTSFSFGRLAVAPTATSTPAATPSKTSFSSTGTATATKTSFAFSQGPVPVLPPVGKETKKLEKTEHTSRKDRKKQEERTEEPTRSRKEKKSDSFASFNKQDKKSHRQEEIDSFGDFLEEQPSLYNQLAGAMEGVNLSAHPFGEFAQESGDWSEEIVVSSQKQEAPEEMFPLEMFSKGGQAEEKLNKLWNISEKDDARLKRVFKTSYFDIELDLREANGFQDKEIVLLAQNFQENQEIGSDPLNADSQDSTKKVRIFNYLALPEADTVVFTPGWINEDMPTPFSVNESTTVRLNEQRFVNKLHLTPAAQNAYAQPVQRQYESKSELKSFSFS